MTTRPASGELLVHEPFDYTGTALDGQNGGVGFASGWVDVPPFFGGPIELSDDGTSLQYPAGIAATPVGARMKDASNGGLALRSLANPIDMAAEGATYYFSALLKKDRVLTGNAILHFDLISSAAAGSVFLMGAGSSSNARTGTSDDFVNGPVLDSGATYFLLSRLITHTVAPDEYSLSLFKVGTDTVPTTEPALYDLTHSVDATGLADNVLVTINAAANGEFDELRIATTYAEAIAVPEPSTLALGSIGMLVMLLAGGRRVSRRAGRTR